MSNTTMNKVPFPPFCPFCLKWAFDPEAGKVGVQLYFKFPPIGPGDGNLLCERECTLTDHSFAFDQTILGFSCHLEIMLNFEGQTLESIGYVFEYYGGDDQIPEQQYAGNIPLAPSA